MKIKIMAFNITHLNSVECEIMENTINQFTKDKKINNIEIKNITNSDRNIIIYIISYEDKLLEFNHIVNDIKKVWNDYGWLKDLGEINKEQIQYLIEKVHDFDYSEYNDYINDQIENLIAEKKIDMFLEQNKNIVKDIETVLNSYHSLKDIKLNDKETEQVVREIFNLDMSEYNNNIEDIILNIKQ